MSIKKCILFLIQILALTLHSKMIESIELNIFDKEESIVTVAKLGKVSGLVKYTLDTPSKKYYQYKGIPFAESVERFAIAKPKLPWLTIHNGKTEGKVCPQPGGNFFYIGNIDEKNCLTLTVTSPQNPNKSTEKLPVLVFFYGGAFIIGATYTNWYNPEYLIQENILVVQVNYRLGAFGWLSDGKLIPKNLGLKDCKLALEWIQNNIASFSGDPNQVTIYGQSAGAIICDALWQSERTHHLFHAVFLQSGTLINPHSSQKNPSEAFKKTIAKSTCAGMMSKPIREQVACLKQISDVQLSWSAAFTYIWEDTIQFGSPTGLVASVLIEDLSDPNAIVIEKPLERLKNGRFPRNKPIMISITSEERITFEFLQRSLRGKSNKALVPGGLVTEDLNSVGKEIKIHYGGSEIGFDKAPDATLVQASSDLFYNNGFRKFIELVQPELQPTAGIYCMQFSYASKLGILNFDGRVGHVDDLFYTWGLEALGHESLRRLVIPKEAYVKRKQLNKLIGNFVKYRNPTPVPDTYLENVVWPKVNNVMSVDCLNFNSTLSIIRNPKNENYGFWMQLYSNTRNPDISL